MLAMLINAWHGWSFAPLSTTGSSPFFLDLSSILNIPEAKQRCAVFTKELAVLPL